MNHTRCHASALFELCRVLLAITPHYDGLVGMSSAGIVVESRDAGESVLAQGRGALPCWRKFSIHLHGMHSESFQPERLLAVGPAAKVYRGVETATGRKVLIKVLLQDHEATHPLDRERLQILAHALMHVRHPQVAGLVTMLPTEDEFVLVYEYMPGMNLRAFVEQRRPPGPADVRALAVQLMHALMAGEALRQPHGDPKPSNLIVADHPAGGLFVQVQDWGLSLARHQQPLETLWFRAPELHSGGQPTSQSDLFTAAASLFVLATGAAPAQGGSVEEVVADWQRFDLQSLRQMRPDMDPSLCDWLGWLLNLEPARRPASVAQALEVLMNSMHTGFIYMPRHAPEMTPGAKTGPLVTGPPASAPMPRPAVPKPTPPKPAAAAPAASTAAPAASKERTTTVSAPAPAAAPPKPKASKGRIFAAVVLNALALLVVGSIAWSMMTEGGFDVRESLRRWLGGGSSLQDSGGDGADAQPATKQTPATKEAAMAWGEGISGRYVRIEMKGKAMLNLAEVQVFSGATDVAFQGNATQSSTEWGGEAARAIDGNTNGEFDKGSVTHTNSKSANPWWQLDLGREMPLNTIIIWNRTDAKYKDRLKNFTVRILSTHQKAVWEKKISAPPSPRLKLTVGE